MRRHTKRVNAFEFARLYSEKHEEINVDDVVDMYFACVDINNYAECKELLPKGMLFIKEFVFEGYGGAYRGFYEQLLAFYRGNDLIGFCPEIVWKFNGGYNNKDEKELLEPYEKYMVDAYEDYV